MFYYHIGFNLAKTKKSKGSSLSQGKMHKCSLSNWCWIFIKLNQPSSRT